MADSHNANSRLQDSFHLHAPLEAVVVNRQKKAAPWGEAANQHHWYYLFQDYTIFSESID